MLKTMNALRGAAGRGCRSSHVDGSLIERCFCHSQSVTKTVPPGECLLERKAIVSSDLGCSQTTRKWLEGAWGTPEGEGSVARGTRTAFQAEVAALL